MRIHRARWEHAVPNNNPLPRSLKVVADALQPCESPESCAEAFAKPSAYNFAQRLAHVTKNPGVGGWRAPEEVMERTREREGQVLSLLRSKQHRGELAKQYVDGMLRRAAEGGR